ncbi:MAG: PQQ-binding-like beta-propeller repeat protein [Planctomycetota bacterium]
MLVLAHTIALASLTAVPAQTDDPTLVTTVVHAETAQGRSRGNDTAAAGTVAVTVGQIRDDAVGAGSVRLAFVRCVERTTATTLWRVDDPSADTALAVALSPDGATAFAVLRTPSIGGAPGLDQVVAYDTTNGAELWRTTAQLPYGDPYLASDVDALVVSPDGTRLLRLDFAIATQSEMRLRSIDTATGQVDWTTTRLGYDPSEYYQSTESKSLDVAPDGSLVFVSFVTYSGGTSDGNVGAWSTTDGTEQWVTTYATPSVTDVVSRPVATADSSGVLVITHVLPQGSPLGPIRRLASSDGSEVWSTPVDFTATCLELSPTVADVAAAGWLTTVLPSNDDVALQSFDVATGASNWSVVLPQTGSLDEPFDLVFAPDGSRLFAHVHRTPDAFGAPNVVEVVGVDPSTGGSATFTSVAVESEFADDFFLDSAMVQGAALAFGGYARLHVPQYDSLGDDPRYGVDAGGQIAYSIATDDELPETADVVGRVWIEPDGAHVLSWKSWYQDGLQTAGIRIERRDTATGQVVSTFELPIAAPTADAFDVALSPDARLLAVQRNVAIGMRGISVFDVRTSALVAEHVPATTILTSLLAWSDDSTQVHWLSRGTFGSRGILDVTTGQAVLSTTLLSGVFNFGSVTPRGLVVDPQSGASYELYHASNPTSAIDELVLARRDTSGAVVWSKSLPSSNVFFTPNTLVSRSTLGGATFFGDVQDALALSPDGATLYLTDIYQSPTGYGSRLGAFDASNGQFQWIAGSTTAPGASPRSVDVEASADGRFVHVLAEGRGASQVDPLRAHVFAYDVQSHQLAWQRTLDESIARARELVSLGEGGRVAAIVVTGDQFATTGGFVAVLDGASGTELGRVVLDEPQGGEYVDADVDDEGHLWIAGARRTGVWGTDGTLERYDLPSLAQGPDELSVSAGGAGALHVDAPASRAGHVYLLVGGVSGTSPGTPLTGGHVLPLNFDVFTQFSIDAANSPLYQGSLGLLDAAGDAHVRLVVPPLPAVFVGLPLVHAAATFDTTLGVASGATSPVALTLVP